MRFSLLALAVGLASFAGCRLEPSAPSPPPDAEVAEAPPPRPDLPPSPSAQPPAPPTPIIHPYAEDGRPEVVLYVTSWCPYCRQAREFMDAEDIPHRVVDIEASPEGAREYAARGGTGSIPLVAVGVETMQGWSADHARKMLDTAGYY